MKLNTLAIACCALLAIPALVAQTGTSGAGISGTWNGSMSRDTDSQPLTITLKADGASITGTVEGPPRPGIIRSGTFDAASGAVKFIVEVQDDAKTAVTFEGKLVKDMVTGTVAMGGQTGNFKLTRAGAAAGPGQSPAGDAATNALRRSFTGVSGYVTKSAEMIPADKYTYRPVASVRTVGQMVAHIIDGYNYFCAAGAGKKVEWSDAAEKGSVDKATLVAKLKQATDACTAAYAGEGDAAAFTQNVGHTNLHYGNLITYMRMLGLTPPSS